ncbi:class I SAM-dependent methyltransferase [Halopiger djelfimassiliensis]|uniref:class I SAM-dependent methyltransferase n=1 Tax=Halopiger djelfimassiliensis TaxID=1293047 RepID=UPI000677ACD0|nr:class I SAM-dependent methyltransferase [Halopiger djelfimassiliensis]
MRYYFGLYHWRRRLARLAFALVVVAGAVLVGRRTASRRVRTLAGLAGLAAGSVGARTARTVLSPPPWRVRRRKYETLARQLPIDGAATVLDVGCGTGRSLVGLAPFVPDDCAVVGLDVFDDRIILGNGPRLAVRNGRAAGIDVSPVAGDATRLPVATDSQDVVTACRVLHDLPADDQRAALAELRRVCAPDGAVGILELPITPDGTTADPESYWTDRITDAGFSIARLERVESDRRTEPHLVFVAEPS